MDPFTLVYMDKSYTLGLAHLGFDLMIFLLLAFGAVPIITIIFYSQALLGDIDIQLKRIDYIPDVLKNRTFVYALYKSH